MIHDIRSIFNVKWLTNRLFWGIILLLILSSSVPIIAYLSIDKKNQTERAKQDIEYALISPQIIVESWLKERAQGIRYLANLSITKEYKRGELLVTFQDVLDVHQDLRSIILLDEEGHVLLENGQKGLMLTSDTDVRKSNYLTAGKQGKEYVDALRLATDDEEPVFIFSAPVFSGNNQFQGVILGVAYLAKMNEWLAQSLKEGSSEIFLLNQEGVILLQQSKQANQGFSEKLNSHGFITNWQNNIVEKILASDKLPTTYLNQQGVEVCGVYTSVANERLFLLYEREQREMLQAHYDMIPIMLTGTLIFTVLAALFISPLFQRLVELSSTDGLTGIANRRIFEEYLEREWLSARRTQQPLSLIFMDLDFFKEFNDTYGHRVGDQCLQKVAHAIRHTLKRPRDMVARYGGEEFVIILPETNNHGAIEMAEEIRKRVEELEIPCTQSQVGYVTASLGVASLVPAATMEKELLIQLADQALYEAKLSGRNKVITNQQ